MNSTNPTHEFKFEGRNYRLFKREESKDAPWYFRIRVAGVRRARSLETNVAENAVAKARAMITASKGEKWTEFLQKTTARQVVTVTRQDIYQLYRAYPNRKPAASTRELNIHALDQILGPGNTLPTADSLWNWKQQVLVSAAAETDPAQSAMAVRKDRHRQLLRSANSRITQARSIFTADLQAHYKRAGKLTLPKTIDDFLKEPRFPTDETGKTDYWPPGDNIIAQTFAALEKLNPPWPAGPDTFGPFAPQEGEDLNLYLAIWLTLGFGLRKSEISQAKASWFVELNGIRYIAGDELAKNDRFPRVRCQLGAWDKLAPHIQGLASADYILRGSDHERTDDVFRRCSIWLRKLGWNTQKAIHEFRSYAGCQIAMGDRKGPVDIRSAQEFLRHANITTTENFYMRYLRSQLKEVHLQIPTIQPFIPQILSA